MSAYAIAEEVEVRYSGTWIQAVVIRKTQDLTEDTVTVWTLEGPDLELSFPIDPTYIRKATRASS